MPRPIYSPVALAAHLANAATLTEHRMNGGILNLFSCPARLSDGSPCTKCTGTRNGLEQHLLNAHALNSRKGHNWRDAHDAAARMQGCEFVRVWSPAEAAEFNEWGGIVVEARVGMFLHGQEAYITRAGFVCERVVWRSQKRTYATLDGGLYAILAPAFIGTPSLAEALRIGHMILAEAEKQHRQDRGNP